MTEELEHSEPEEGSRDQARGVRGARGGFFQVTGDLRASCPCSPEALRNTQEEQRAVEESASVADGHPSLSLIQLWLHPETLDSSVPQFTQL